MTPVQIGSRSINADNIAFVATGVTAQPPGKPHVDDAVRIHFLGDTQPLTLFGDDAKAAADAFAPKPAEPAPVEPAKAEPEKPAPAPTAKPAPAAVVTPAPAAVVKS